MSYNRIMKTTIDIPENELREAIRHTGAETKREAVVTALIDFNRRQRLAALIEQFGTFEEFLTHQELRQLRNED